ncbi:MAG: Fur family transcriptional regulator [Bacillota bacterium]
MVTNCPGNPLHSHGRKLTPQRRLILQVILACGDHLTAEEVHRRVKAHRPRLNLATVYRNLNMLAQLRLIGKVDLGDGRARFEARTDHHHHLYCLSCGQIIELDSCPLERCIAPGFLVTSHKFEIQGYCSSCQAAKSSQPTEVNQ